MILDPFLLMMLLLFVALSLTALFFSPAIVELKKPKDKGPRRISKTPLERRIMNIGRKPTVKSDLEGRSDILHIFGNHAFPSRSVILADVVVEGFLKVDDDCVFHRSVKAGDGVLIGNRVTIEGNLVSEDDVTILDDVVVGGSVHSEGSVTIGEEAFVALSVVAVGDVEVGKNSEIVGGIFTRGAVKGPRQAKVDLPSSIDEIG